MPNIHIPLRDAQAAPAASIIVRGRPRVECACGKFSGANEAAAAVRLQQRLDILSQEAHAAPAKAKSRKLAGRSEPVDGALADLKDGRNVGAGHKLA